MSSTTQYIQTIQKLESALHAARHQLAVLGGDFSHLPRREAESAGCDMIQWYVLNVIDDALGRPDPVTPMATFGLIDRSGSMPGGA